MPRGIYRREHGRRDLIVDDGGVAKHDCVGRQAESNCLPELATSLSVRQKNRSLAPSSSNLDSSRV